MKSPRSSTRLGLALLTLPGALGPVAAGCSDSDSPTPTNEIVLSPADGATLSPDASQHRFYEERFVVSSGGTAPYRFSEIAGGLPDGLFLIMADGSGKLVAESDDAELIGFPEVEGIDDVEFRVTDDENRFTEPTYELETTPAAAAALNLSPDTGTELTDGEVGTAYAPVTLTIGNGMAPYNWDVVYGSLPDGLILEVDPSGNNSAEAEITGTPTESGVWVFAIEVEDSNPRFGGSAYQITVN